MTATAPVPAPDASDLGAALEQRVLALWWMLTRELPSDVSRTGASVLATLREDGPQRVTSLAAHETIAQPSMSQLLKRLEQRGLVERREDPADGRACRMAITPAGLNALEDRSAARAAWLEPRLERLGADARAAIAAALAPIDALLATGGTPA